MTKPLDVYKTRRRWTAVEARAALAAQASSGLSESAFAAREGLDSQRLRAWRRRLSAEVQRPAFVEIGPRPAERVEIVLPSGVIVRVAESIDRVRLHNIVAALDDESRC
jgi:hypothetical protein